MRKNSLLHFLNTRRSAFALVLACVLFVSAGCDSNNAADEADREELRGSWFITDLQVDGAREFASLDNQYPNAVLFRLRVDENEDELFRAQSLNDRGDTLLIRTGTFDVDADESTLELNTFRNIDLLYDLSQSETENPERIELTADDDADAENLVRLLRLGGFGNVEKASIIIARERVFTSSLRSSLRPSFLKRPPTPTRQP